MSGTTYTETTTLKKIVCGACGIIYAVPLEWYEAKQKSEEGFSCPNGDRRKFSVSLESQLRAELAAAKADAASKQRWLEIEERRHGETRVALSAQKMKTLAEKSAKAKLKRRAAGGACPCCNRQFENLRRHMACKHPGFAHKE